jgi:hypothetical protein
LSSVNITFYYFFLVNIVACRPVVRQQPRNIQWTTPIARQQPEHQWTGRKGVFPAIHAIGFACNDGYSSRGTIFSVWSMPRCYKEN